MTDKARELLERALAELIDLDNDLRSELCTERGWDEPKVIEEIRDFLSTPEPKQCEVCGEGKVIEMRYWLCDSCRSEYTDATQLKSIKAQTDKARTPEPEQDEEPVAWMNGMRNLLSWDKFYEDMTPLYLHPAPRKPFVRLSEEEMKNCWGEPDKLNTQALINFARAIEDALEEKNK